MFSALGVTFAEILKNEWLGIVASAFVLVSFLFSKQTITRLINICGCVAFVIYGILLPAYSTAFMNAALIIVHIVFLVKDYLAKKKAKRQAELPDSGDRNGDDEVFDLTSCDETSGNDSAAETKKITDNISSENRPQPQEAAAKSDND